MKTVIARDDLDAPVTAQALERAITLGRQRSGNGLQATEVRYLQALQSLLIGFRDQTAVVLPIQNYPELAELTTEELDRLSIGFGGSALCLEARDLHVSIVGLVLASQPLTDMAATVIASRNGSHSSRMKAASSRVNGQKGGRPRKNQVVL